MIKYENLRFLLHTTTAKPERGIQYLSNSLHHENLTSFYNHHGAGCFPDNLFGNAPHE